MRIAPHRLLLAAGALTVMAAAGSAVAAPSSNGQGASVWHVGYYNPSNRAFSDARATAASDGSPQVTIAGAPNTALLTTDQGKQKNLLGDMTGKTLMASMNVAGDGVFTYYGEGTADNPCGTPANVRLYFTTSNAGGFDETHYWWSSPSAAPLANGPLTVSANVDPTMWTDYNGHSGADPVYSAGFAAAAANVTSIGLSFGGGCFFENGVGTSSGSSTLTLNSFSATP